MAVQDRHEEVEELKEYAENRRAAAEHSSRRVASLEKTILHISTIVSIFFKKSLNSDNCASTLSIKVATYPEKIWISLKIKQKCWTNFG